MTLETTHRIILGDSRKMDSLSDNSVDLVVTSPPYPMITMWDDLFCKINPQIRTAIDNDGMIAFRLMHEELDKTWNELERVVKPGGIVCINIGDATRKIANSFKIYPNHSRITLKMIELGFDPLPPLPTPRFYSSSRSVLFQAARDGCPARGRRCFATSAGLYGAMRARSLADPS